MEDRDGDGRYETFTTQDRNSEGQLTGSTFEIYDKTGNVAYATVMNFKEGWEKFDCNGDGIADIIHDENGEHRITPEASRCD
ncbi:hypothetical protein ACFL96_06040, partial [Thermoproteota archaeon]